MSKSQANPGTLTPKSRTMDTRQVAVCALLCALNVVLARFLTVMPSGTVRLSVEAIPIVLAGYFFGPVSGMIVGFLGDTIGCLFSPYGWNPLICVSPMLVGAFAGILRPLVYEVKKPVDIWRVVVTLLPGKLLGSVLWNSLCFIWLGFSSKGLGVLMGARLLETSVEIVLDSVVLMLLLRLGVFSRMRLFPPAKVEKKPINGLRVAACIMLLVELVALCVGDLTGRLDFLNKELEFGARALSTVLFALPLVAAIVLFALSGHKREEHQTPSRGPEL